MSTADRVLTRLVEVAEAEEVRTNAELRLYDLHLLDSMKTVELMVAFEEEFGLQISPAEFEPADWATPAKIVAYVEGRVQS
ncbi:MAG TPA: D-alanine--poly(phosphoribitol) ligase subunit DltC [Gemmatimonadales bacterium]|nr:D-alanine--poly(phosphoribitol) ligase subunit DltC [Gemmatimonadales bacterium]